MEEDSGEVVHWHEDLIKNLKAVGKKEEWEACFSEDKEANRRQKRLLEVLNDSWQTGS